MTLLDFDIAVYIINLAIALPTFFLVRLIVREITKAGLLRKVLTWIGTVILTPLIYVGLVLIFIGYLGYYSIRDFNATLWRSGYDKRYQMTSHLIESQLLIGKTKNEVGQILGDDFYKCDEDHWGYDVGFVPGLFNIDPDILDIYFEDGKVKRVEQHES